MIIFFFKQKTAYEMRISDWSSDVCSSDLPRSGGKLIDEAFGEKGGGAVRARPPDARFKSGIGMAMRHLQRRNVIGRDRALDRISIRALVDRYSRQPRADERRSVLGRGDQRPPPGDERTSVVEGKSVSVGV